MLPAPRISASRPASSCPQQRALAARGRPASTGSRSGSWVSTVRGCAASCAGGPIRNSTAVTLSSPPCASAARTRSRAICSQLLSAASSFANSSSATMSVRPSLQSSTTSPSCASSQKVSTCTVASAPSTRVTTFRCGWLLGLPVGDLAGRDQLGHHRVVLGEASQVALAQQVGAAVADVGQRHAAVAFDQRRRHGSAHAGGGGVAGGALVDAGVGE